MDPELRRLERSATARAMRKLRVVVWVDRAAVTTGSGEEMLRRVRRACDVVRLAKGLRELTVEWVSDAAEGMTPEAEQIIGEIESRLGVTAVTRRPGRLSVL